ncbi:hypothetical protein PSQ40_13070 [Curvibacter sp. HBC61]|uniref:Uncharacterized protein n=1 Tax=Curvibacter cyanobacteriorum TaxID=3026422 RepID=A0ABT5MZL2_9BURK|nr:hypothetical protein [Curvibacter sp. HBC61]MDD0839509.1 hypothetical protein [Curvibacter sp. HBC61]
MSLFAWLFGRKTPRRPAAVSAAPSTDKSRPGAGKRSQKAWVDVGPAPAPSTVKHKADHKAERLQQRELLYTVVRDTMVRVGVLSSRYKFKVLSLDSHGRQFMVMMDVAPEVAADSVRLSEIEVLLAQTAKARHQILVTSVYWRANNQVSTGVLPPRGAGALSAVGSATEPAAPSFPSAVPAAPRAPAAQGHAAAPRFEPIQAEEVAAFHRALAEMGAQAPALAQSVQSGPRLAGRLTGFEDTEMPEDADDSRPQSLSTTQYGDL